MALVDVFTIGDIDILTADVSPVSSGIAVSLGSVASLLDGTGIYLKTGAGSTNWSKFVTLANLTDITSVGTVTSGTWQGTSIATTYTDAKIKGSVSATAGLIPFGTGTADTVTSTTSTGLSYSSGTGTLNVGSTAEGNNIVQFNVLTNNRGSISNDASVTAFRMSSTGGTKLQFGIDASYYVSVNGSTAGNAGNVFFGGTTTATAKVHVAAGTAAAGTAPIKMTIVSSALLSTPESGAVEVDANGMLYYTPSSLRKIVHLLSHVTKNSNYVATLDDYTIECVAGTFSITLPTAVGIAGRRFMIKKSGTGITTVNTTSSQTIDDLTSQSLIQYDSMEVESDGANWDIV